MIFFIGKIFRLNPTHTGKKLLWMIFFVHCHLKNVFARLIKLDCVSSFYDITQANPTKSCSTRLKDFWSSASKDQISFPVGSWTFTITVIALNEIKCFECSNMLLIIKRKEIWFWLVSFFDFLRLGSDFSLRGSKSYGLFYDFGRSKRYDRSL